MPIFFINDIKDGKLIISDHQVYHLIKSRRVKIGQSLILCDKEGSRYNGIIENIGDIIELSIVDQINQDNEPTVDVHLYQCLSKGSKFELIIQKSVELGVKSITPVVSSRTIVNHTSKTFDNKLIRYNKIAFEACKQCNRSFIPQVNSLISYDECIKYNSVNNYTSILFYEKSCNNVNNILKSVDNHDISILIGSEGGFSEEEVELALENGLFISGLGKRILRCETAPIAAISIIMNITGNM